MQPPRTALATWVALALACLALAAPALAAEPDSTSSANPSVQTDIGSGPSIPTAGSGAAPTTATATASPARATVTSKTGSGLPSTGFNVELAFAAGLVMLSSGLALRGYTRPS